MIMGQCEDMEYICVFVPCSSSGYLNLSISPADQRREIKKLVWRMGWRITIDLNVASPGEASEICDKIISAKTSGVPITKLIVYNLADAFCDVDCFLRAKRRLARHSVEVMCCTLHLATIARKARSGDCRD